MPSVFETVREYRFYTNMYIPVFIPRDLDGVFRRVVARTFTSKLASEPVYGAADGTNIAPTERAAACSRAVPPAARAFRPAEGEVHVSAAKVATCTCVPSGALCDVAALL